jgi:hypothetical protein
MDETDEESEQGKIPDWLLDNQPVGEQLIRQSFRHLEKDQDRLLGVVRSSISRVSSKSLPENIDSILVTGNLRERKRRLEESAKLGLGDKYDIAYKFIEKYGQERREELLSELGIGNGGKVPELELKMIETITAIEACE